MFKRSILVASILSLSACAQIASAQTSAQTADPAASGSVLDNAKALFNKFIDIRVKDNAATGDADVHVKVPFVNVDVKDGQKKVNVHAPFVNVSKATGTPVAVKAPFVNKNAETTSVKTPAVNVVKNTAEN